MTFELLNLKCLHQMLFLMLIQHEMCPKLNVRVLRQNELFTSYVVLG